MRTKNRSSRQNLSYALALLLFIYAPALSAATSTIENFKNDTPGSFPKNWKTYPLHGGKAKKTYQVTSEDGKNFLRAVDADGDSVQIFHEFSWDVQKFPYLKFKWRAQDLPEGGRETARETNDSACGVYIGFGRSSALKFVWSASLPVGAYWEKDAKKFFIIVAESGPSGLGQWKSLSLRVPDEYQRYFKQALTKSPSGIAILTDGNRTRQKAACDYADFQLSDTP